MFLRLSAMASPAAVSAAEALFLALACDAGGELRAQAEPAVDAAMQRWASVRADVYERWAAAAYAELDRRGGGAVAAQHLLPLTATAPEGSGEGHELSSALVRLHAWLAPRWPRWPLPAGASGGGDGAAPADLAPHARAALHLDWVRLRLFQAVKRMVVAARAGGQHMAAEQVRRAAAVVCSGRFRFAALFVLVAFCSAYVLPTAHGPTSVFWERGARAVRVRRLRPPWRCVHRATRWRCRWSVGVTLR